METNLLQTKLYTPSLRPSLVPRPHLVAKLDGERPCKLILLSAPAGYGKTTLITEWIAQVQQKTTACWLSLDEDDSDPQQFFSYLAAATRSLSDTQSSLSQFLHSPQPLPAKNLMAAFLNDVTPVSTPFALILDDYHVIESAEIDRVMAFLLDRMPPQMTLVITSRSDPGFPISRLRARGELVELRADDLRFSEVEAAQFLQQNMNLTLSPDQIAALENRTEGWIAGLQMAALSMQNRSDVARFIDNFTGSHRFIMDFLLEEVLNQQPAVVQKFLLETAVLDRLSADLCDAVRQSLPSSQEILEQLETHNLFLISLDNERRWYRYHNLFAELLQQRLHQNITFHADAEGRSVAELHSRASQWYEENGPEIKAIHHAIAANDYERTARLIELAWPTMDGTFQTATWLDWAKTIPVDLIRTRPVLNVAYAWALLNGGELEGAEAHLQDAERWLDTGADTDVSSEESQMIVVDEEQFRTLPASMASARTYYAQAVGDVPNTLKYAQQALDLLPEDDFIRRGPAASILGLVYWADGKLEAAYQTLAMAMNGFRQAGQILFAISGTYGLADMRIAQGRLGEAVKTYERALKLALEQGEPAIRGTTDIYWGLRMLSFERGDTETANRYLLKSEELGEEAALPDWPYRRFRGQARIKEIEGAFDVALKLLDEAERIYIRTPVPNVRPVGALKAQVRIKQSELAKAREWADEQSLSVDDDLSYLREFEHITLARLLIAEYKNTQTERFILEAVSLLNRLLKPALDEQRMGSVLEILVVQALAYEAQGDISSSQMSLERALTIAEPEGYVCLFINEGIPMAQLLSTIADREIMPNYVGKLLAAFEDVGQGSVDTSVQPSADQPLVDPLSKRELEILMLIAAGLKNKEIADQLVISLNTVLYHIKNIYGKLGVNKRTLAVAKAKEINLI
ncbi:MAG: LuxR C-terminal-related transcriptional regulator [Ardenticatenaceae bacterium]|nr:LuxR C-terminal-related transcriptional regulator [Ardenticatenaceae bacterium]